MRGKGGIALLALVLSALDGGRATADDAVPSPAQALSRANDLAGAGQYPEALELLGRVLAENPKHHELLKLRGELLLQRRDFEQALAAYEAYLAANPRGANRRKARRIIADLGAVRTTFLEVKTDVGQAQVYLDAQSLGVYCVADPVCKKGMLPGRYRIYIEREGFFPVVQRVDVELGKTAVIDEKLKEKPSALSIAVEPADAQVMLDGKALGSGAQRVEVLAGDHELEVALVGFVADKRTVSAHEGKAVSASVALAERVPVDLSEPAATLTLDGKPVKLDGGTVVVPPDGADHVLRAQARGFREAEATIAATRARGASVTLRLEKIEVEKPLAPATPPESLPSPGWSGKRKVLFGTLLTLTAAGAGATGFFTFQAKARHGDANQFCDRDGHCTTREGVDFLAEAHDHAMLANISAGVAGAALVGAALVFFTAPSSSASEAPPVSASVGPDSVGVQVRWGF